MTGGDERGATAATLRPVITLWQTTLEHAGYVWLTGDTAAQIPWTDALYGYFRAHFRLAGFAGQAAAWGDVPRPGLYIRTLTLG